MNAIRRFLQENEICRKFLLRSVLSILSAEGFVGVDEKTNFTLKNSKKLLFDETTTNSRCQKKSFLQTTMCSSPRITGH
jgi:hypothetical protein